MTTHNLTPGCRRRTCCLLTVLAAVFLLAGCTQIRYANDELTVTRFLTDSEIGTLDIDIPNKGKVKLEGYKSGTRAEILLELLREIK